MKAPYAGGPRSTAQGRVSVPGSSFANQDHAGPTKAARQSDGWRRKGCSFRSVMKKTSVRRAQPSFYPPMWDEVMSFCSICLPNTDKRLLLLSQDVIVRCDESKCHG